MKVSALILTLNEEANLPRCLDALTWCDEIVVVDSFSTDRTVDIARERGARVFQRRFVSFADQRNFGLEQWRNEERWVLHLDADEVVTPELRREIEALPHDPAFDSFRIAGKLMFGNQWLRHSGMYPVYQVRLTRQPRFRFIQVGHGQREPEGSVAGTLQQGYEHYAFSKGLADWFERHNRYSSDEARLAAGSRTPSLGQLIAGDPVERRRAAKALSYRLPFRPWLRFAYVYFLRLGILDGAAGLRYAKLLATYERMIDAKVWEQRQAR